VKSSIKSRRELTQSQWIGGEGGGGILVTFNFGDKQPNSSFQHRFHKIMTGPKTQWKKLWDNFEKNLYHSQKMTKLWIFYKSKFWENTGLFLKSFPGLFPVHEWSACIFWCFRIFHWPFNINAILWLHHRCLPRAAYSCSANFTFVGNPFFFFEDNRSDFP